MSYSWVVPSGAIINSGQGTNSLSVTFGLAGGNLTVTPSNSCGTGPAASMSVTLTPLLGTTGAIIGSVSPCEGTTVTYSVPPVSNATSYTWTVPLGWTIVSGQNTPSITATVGVVGGDIAVTANNNCGSGNISSLAVSVLPLPGSTGIISGSVAVCENTSANVYSISAVPNATGYTWVVPSGWTITSGQNTTNILATSGNAGGNITVIATNNCASSNSSVLPVIVNLLPVTSAGNDQSIGYGATATLNGSATGGSGIYSWHWEPASLLINPNIQNPVTVNLTSTTQFTLTVTDVSSTCTGSDQVLVNITGGPLSLMAIATPETSCAGNTVQLMALTGGGTGNYTYSWTSVPVGFTSNIQNPIANPLETTTYTVVVNDGNATLSDLVLVTVNPLPTTPLLPSGPDRVDLVYVSQSQYTAYAVANSDSYTWELSPANAGSINGTDTIATVTWNPNYLGNATINVRSVNGCGESSWSAGKTTRVDNTVRITEPNEQTAILVYPNPNDGRFAIKCPKAIDKVILMDAAGKTIDEVLAPKPNHRYEYKLTEGVYLVHIYIGKAEYVRKMVLK
jgi:hypothetical protein